MDTARVELTAVGFDRGTVWCRRRGRPVIVFPAEAGRAWDFADRGMLAAVAPLVDAGQVKLYCVDSFDEATWSNRALPIEDRARGHLAYEAWITGPVLDWVRSDSPGAGDPLTTGVGMVAFHAVQSRCAGPTCSLPHWPCRATTTRGGTRGADGDAAYATNPCWYVPGLEGGHLDWLRSRLDLLLVVGRGPFETSRPGPLPSTRLLAGLLADKGIRVELDEWGEGRGP